MTRTVISLDPKEKKWLDEEAKRSGKPMTEVVRIAIRYMREEKEKSFDDLLHQTSGTWREGDGLAYQRRVRSEWE
jgi:hypothetical protein